MPEDWFEPNQAALDELARQAAYRAFLRSFSSEGHDFFDAGLPDKEPAS